MSESIESCNSTEPNAMGAFLASPTNPKVVIILSGKRKSGKDHIARVLEKTIPNYVIIRIAGPIKAQYAEMHNLNLLEMMSDSEYKEHHRLQMVEWSTELRKKDPNCFLRASIKENQADQYPVWILTDARRDCDIEYFEQTELFKKLNTKVIRLRIAASDQVRQQRGYVFTPSIDDAPTECGLDHYTKWDHVIENNDLSEEQLLEHLKPILDQCQF